MARSGSWSPAAGEGIQAEPDNSGSFLLSFPQARQEPGGPFLVSVDLENPAWYEDSYLTLYRDVWMESNDTRVYAFRLLLRQRKMLIEEGIFDNGGFRSNSILHDLDLNSDSSPGESFLHFAFEPQRASVTTEQGSVAEFPSPFASPVRFVLPSLSSNEQLLIQSMSISSLLPEAVFVYALQIPVQSRLLYKYNDGATRWVRDNLNPIWEGPPRQRNSVFDPAVAGDQGTFPIYNPKTGLATFVYLGSSPNEQMYLRGEINNWEIREEDRLMLVGNLE